MENNLAVMKAAFTAMSATQGWPYFVKFAERVIAEMERLAIDEVDDELANGFRRDARGARVFWTHLLKRVEMAKAQNTEEQEDPSDKFYAILEMLSNERSANA